jgi:hypothetical protein
MKLLVEIIVSLVLHPLAVVLMLINLLARADLGPAAKIIWAIIGILAWGIGPILYILIGGGTLW